MLVSNDGKSLTHALHLATQAKELSDCYEHRELGYNYRLSNVSAAIGVGQLEKLDELIELKQGIWNRYNRAFRRYEEYGVGMVQIPTRMTSNYWLSVLLLGNKSRTTPTDIVRSLRSKSIEARHIWKPLHTQELWKGADFVKTSLTPCSDWFFEHGVCLPTDVNMTEEDQEYVIDAVGSAIDWSIRLYYQQGY